MKAPQGPSCITQPEQTSTLTANIQTLFLLGKFYSESFLIVFEATENLDFQKHQHTFTQSSLKSLNEQTLPTQCDSYQNIGIINYNQLQNQIYTIGYPQREFIFDQFTYSVACKEALQFQYTASLTDLNPLPSYVQFQTLAAGGGKFLVQSTDPNTVGTYRIKLTGNLNNLYQNSYEFDLIFSNPIELNIPPYFESDLSKTLIIEAGSQLHYDLPTIKDKNIEDYVILSLRLQLKDETPRFLQYSKKRLTLRPEFLDIGEHKIILVLQDDNILGSLKSEYLMTLKVKRTQEYRKNPIDGEKQNEDTEHQQNNNYNGFYNLTENLVKVNSNNREPTLTIDVGGDLDLKGINSTNIEKYLEIKERDETTRNLKSWNFIELKNGTIKILLDYYDDSKVSIFQDPDFLEVKFKVSKNLSFSKSVQLQVLDQDDDGLAQINKVVSLMITSLLYSGIASSILFGYESSNFIYLIGSEFVLIFLYILLLFLYLVVHQTKTKFGIKISDYLKSILFFNVFTRYFIECCLEAGFSIILNKIYFDNQQQRLIFILTVFMLENYLAAQIQIFMIINLIYLIYLISTKPIIGTLDVEVFNEITTLILNYLMLIYSDFIQDSNTKHQFSYVFIGIFLANILINIIIIIFEIFQQLRIRLCYKRKRLAISININNFNTNDPLNQDQITIGNIIASTKKRQIDLTIINEENEHYQVTVEDLEKAEVDISFSNSNQNQNISKKEAQHIDEQQFKQRVQPRGHRRSMNDLFEYGKDGQIQQNIIQSSRLLLGYRNEALSSLDNYTRPVFSQLHYHQEQNNNFSQSHQYQPNLANDLYRAKNMNNYFEDTQSQQDNNFLSINPSQINDQKPKYHHRYNSSMEIRGQDSHNISVYSDAQDSARGLIQNNHQKNSSSSTLYYK
ncbi:UNKNOWN [Stylonychia lemnae]|uniref:Cadherin domain-containing protein n=1 Tax=Stylonychia lemnae TaxID=5949 RepID=A0A078A9T8_STYLE|nr:UNKNOWN [Stylonychia lemnae]|eukprot:CDW78944.1 UNKNOWN [Stylonychia lemnae]